MGLLGFLSRVGACAPLGLWLLIGQACKRAPASDGRTHAAAAASTSTAPTAASLPSTVASPPASAPPFVRFVGDKLFEGKCPNYVRGARTQIADTKEGMRVTISATSEAAIAEIRSRSHYLADGKSTGTDGTGRCPVQRDTQIEVTETEQGVELHVRPPAGTSAKKMRELARKALAKIPAT
jgi:hypothetical protein